MHYEQRAKDRMVTDEHPGYDARAHWCGEDVPYNSTLLGDMATLAPRPNLRRVRAWAEWAGATWRIVTLLAVFALGFALGVYAESAVWR